MRAEVRLDSAVFQLTPTRTRCDLVIIANGKTEKVASGLLNPFLAHLRVAQEQIAKGGYSITLEPDPSKDAEWFTKGTLERFVRFVSTPEVLERVNTIESEILQIDEAIAIQGNDSLGLSTVDDHQTKSAETHEGSRPNYGADTEKAIVLYKPGTHAPDSNGSLAQEENSKVHLLRVLDTRKTVLRKEQGMAFARAVAAGFDMDHMTQLISFAECFGAQRLLEACLRFMDLWKAKHESGQWVEIEAAEAMSSRSEYLNSSGIILSGDIGKHKEYREVWPVANGDAGPEGYGKDGPNADANSGLNRDRRSPSDPHSTFGTHEYYQGQFQHPMCPPWPIHSAPGAPVFQTYPIQGMPYYQNYPGAAPFFHSPYPPMEDSRLTNSRRKGMKRQSVDGKDSNTESSLEVDGSGDRSKDTTEQTLSEDEEGAYQGRRSHRKTGRSGKKKPSGKVVKEVSKRHDSSDSETQSTSDSESGEDCEHLHHEVPERKHKHKHKHSSRSIKKKNSQRRSTDFSDTQGKDESACDQAADSGNWQVFQSFLMRPEEENPSTNDRGMFSGEREPPAKRKENKVGGDPIIPVQRDTCDRQGLKVLESDSVNAKTARLKQGPSNDEFLFSADDRGLKAGSLDSQFKEIEGGGRGYRTAANDEFMVHGSREQRNNKSFSDPLAENEVKHAVHVEKRSLYNVTDESFIVPLRSEKQEEFLANSRTALDIDYQVPSSLQRIEDSSNETGNQLNYEPHDLSLIPERGEERKSIGYDPAIDYDMEIHNEDFVKLKTENQETDPSNNKEGKVGKEKKPRDGQDTLENRKVDLTKKGRSSKSNPLAEAQARAQRLRAYKVDLQKAKKEKEEEEIKRLEALKLERQKRIAARSGSLPPQTTPTPQQTRVRLPAKVSPGSYKSSKFSDSEPALSSPLRKLHGRTTSLVSNGSIKTLKSNTSDPDTQLTGKELSRSVSSLPDLKKERNSLVPEESAASLRSKRLSDLKDRNSSRVSSQKQVISDKPKKTTTDEPQKKISAILQLDKTKSATLPELKIKAVKGTSDTKQKKSSVKVAAEEEIGTKGSHTSESNRKEKAIGKATNLSNVDESPVIDKTIVMLEMDTHTGPAPLVAPTEERACLNNGARRNGGSEKIELGPECAVASPSPSPSLVLMGEVEISSKHEVLPIYVEDESEKQLNSRMTVKTYQAPYARVTSLEDPTTTSLDYSGVPAALNDKVMPMGSDNMLVQLPTNQGSMSVEQVHGASEKPHNKESSKGLRKLFKFGKKNHSSVSGDHNLESDCSSIDDSTGSATSADVPILKNLISQDDTHVAGSTPKVSRPFSILSPFRTKTNEKKLAA